MLRRLKPFDVKLHYTDRHRLPDEVERELGLTFHPTRESLVAVCDVVTINAPLHPETEDLFDDAMLAHDEARRLSDQHGPREDLRPRRGRAALESGQLAGYAGDVWFPQPAPADHPWRTMPHHGMTPHISGILAVGAGPLRRRNARDPRVLLRRVARSATSTSSSTAALAGTGAHSYTPGNATTGSDSRS